MRNSMQIIYTGLEQIIHPKLNEYVPTSRPHTSIQIVYTGFEQIDSLLFGTNHQKNESKPQEQKMGMLMFNH